MGTGGNPPSKQHELEENFLQLYTRKFYMKKSRFTGSQILAILKQAKGDVAVPELCRQHGMSSTALYKWRSKYGVWTLQ